MFRIDISIVLLELAYALKTKTLGFDTHALMIPTNLYPCGIFIVNVVVAVVFAAILTLVFSS